MQNEIVEYLKNLREEIICAFTDLESSAIFTREPWQHKERGGGEIAILRGHVFEKAAVNFSAVSGDSFPFTEAKGPYFATGISLITHMCNPHAPTVHMNLRYMQTENKVWLGGGYDLTPMGFIYDEDTSHFHRIAKANVSLFGEDLYERFAKWAKEYFFIPHYQKERGVGGLFFDHLGLEHLPLWKQVGNSFLDTILPIYKKRVAMPFSTDDRSLQLTKRAHYVEFNLLYDKGTKFGFLSGGNPKAILCSMPPLASW